MSIEVKAMQLRAVRASYVSKSSWGDGNSASPPRLPEDDLSYMTL